MCFGCGSAGGRVLESVAECEEHLGVAQVDALAGAFVGGVVVACLGVEGIEVGVLALDFAGGVEVEAFAVEAEPEGEAVCGRREVVGGGG